jgi:hypothetical protein
MPVTRIENLTPLPQPEQTRVRTAVRGPTFGEVLKSGLGVVLQGAAAAANVGAPLLMSAVRMTAGAAAGAAGAGASAGGAGGGAGALSSTGSGDDYMSQVKELQQQSRDMNLEMLALQEQTQQENRRFTTVSNVLKARHDTAKAAISNIRP